MLSRKSLATVLVGSCLIIAGTAWSALMQSVSESARAYVGENLARFGLDASDVGEMAVSSEVASSHNGVTHVYFQQRYRGIDVYNGILNVNVGRDGRVISADSRFFAGHRRRRRRAKRETRSGGRGGSGRLSFEPQASGAPEGDGPQGRLVPRRRRSRAAGQSGDRRQSRLDAADRRVRLAWRLEIEEDRRRALVDVFVDAETGEVLAQQDLIVHDFGGRHRERLPAPQARRDRRLSGFAGPTAPPTTSSRCRSRARATAAASSSPTPPTPPPRRSAGTTPTAPPGPEFTVTRGNNVHAYADRDANNVADPGSDPDGGPGLVFDFPLDLTPAPRLPAARGDEPLLLEQHHARRHLRLWLRRGGGQLPDEQLRQGRPRRTTTSGPRPRTAAAPTTPTSARRWTDCGRGCRCSCGARRTRTRSSFTHRHRSPARISGPWPDSARVSSTTGPDQRRGGLRRRGCDPGIPGRRFPSTSNDLSSRTSRTPLARSR